MTDRITTDPDVCHGKPTIRGLRYPVEMILELLTAGMSVEKPALAWKGGAKGRRARSGA